MHENFKLPPKAKDKLTDINLIVKRLSVLIGKEFTFIANKQRTNGTALRKRIAEVLHEFDLSEAAVEGSFKIIPKKGKGIPKIKREFLDTYIVSSGDSYNLQVWNRIPNSDSILIEYTDGKHLRSSDVRFILVKIDTIKNRIDSIVAMSAEYIENRFGKFGKQTVKHQLIISDRGRKLVASQPDSILFHADDISLFKQNTISNISLKENTINDKAELKKIVPLTEIKNIIAKSLVGKKILPGPTKNRGQSLEIDVAKMLGYQIYDPKATILVGGYPDIRHQALEVKVQDSPTVDLGKYTPEFDIKIPDCLNLSTKDIRYLIALTDPQTNCVEGVVLCPGKYLEKYFTHVADKSYKCQRSIPMSFFESLKGKCVYNP